MEYLCRHGRDIPRMDEAGGLQPKGTDWLINRSIIEIWSRIDGPIYRLNKWCSREVSETWIRGPSSDIRAVRFSKLIR